MSQELINLFNNLKIENEDELDVEGVFDLGTWVVDDREQSRVWQTRDHRHGKDGHVRVIFRLPPDEI